MPSPPSGPHATSSQIRFGAAYFAFFAIIGAVSPYFQKLLHLQGFHEQQIGFIIATGGAAGALTQPLWGWLSDRSRHRRRILAVVAISAGACFAAFGWVHTYALAVVAGAAFGLFFRTLAPLIDGMALRYMAEHGGDYGRVRWVGTLAFVLIVLLMESVGVAGDAGRTIILTSVVTCCGLAALTAALLPLTGREVAERRSNESVRREFHWRALVSGPFLVVVFAGLVSRTCMSGHYSFFTLYLEKEFEFRQAGYLWVIGPASEMIVLFYSTALIKRFGARIMLILGLGAVAVRLFGYALVPSVWFVIPLQTLHALTFGATHASSLHYIQRIVPHDMKQSAMALHSALTMSLGPVAGSALGGVLIHHYDYRTMFACYGALALAGTVVLALMLRDPEGEPGGDAAQEGPHAEDVEG